MTGGECILEIENSPKVEVTSGIWRQDLLFGKQLSLSLYTILEGTQLNLQTASNEHAGYILSGNIESGTGEAALKEGTSYLLGQRENFSLSALQDSKLICCLSPGTPDGEPAPFAQSEVTLLSSDEAPKVEMFEGFWRQTLVTGQKLMLCLFTFRKGARLPNHNHHHEQSGYVVSGSVELTVESRKYITRAGCSYFITGHQFHSAIALDDSVVIDAFSPPREEYV